MTWTSKCIRCGEPITVEAAGAFAGAAVVGCLCPSCSDRQTAEADGVVLHLREEDGAGCFPLGKITVTPGAIAALSDAVEYVGTYVTRHVGGDWGSFGHFDQTELSDDELRRGWEATEDDAKINTSNLLNGRDRILRESLKTSV